MFPSCSSHTGLFSYLILTRWSPVTGPLLRLFPRSQWYLGLCVTALISVQSSLLKEAFSDFLAQVEPPYTLKALSPGGWSLQPTGRFADKYLSLHHWFVSAPRRQGFARHCSPSSYRTWHTQLLAVVNLESLAGLLLRHRLVVWPMWVWIPSLLLIAVWPWISHFSPWKLLSTL